MPIALRSLSLVLTASAVSLALAACAARPPASDATQVHTHAANSRVHPRADLHPECPVCNLYITHRDGIVRIVTADGQGSGIIISPEGDILTSAHVVKDQSVVLVSTYQGQEAAGKVVAQDIDADLAVVRLEPGATPWTAIELESEPDVPVGSGVFVIGHPVGLGWTVSQGIISARRRAGEVAPTALIQTDAAVSPGNSGGALLASDGHLLGVIRSKLVGQGIENVSFAVPLADVRVFLARVPPRKS